jgi:hypothetical protein
MDFGPFNLLDRFDTVRIGFLQDLGAYKIHSHGYKTVALFWGQKPDRNRSPMCQRQRAEQANMCG